MPRRLRLEYEGAIYHVVARGNARQAIVNDDRERERLLQDLARAVVRSSWEVLAFVLMTDHIHILLKTPRPNLGRGMQGFLSSYAHWCLRHRGQSGHLFQGRYKADLIENESYYWPVSRYIHLNPVRCALVENPSEWEWSSYPGYARRKARRPWLAHDALLGAMPSEQRAKDAAAAYRRYVENGIANPPPSPFRDAIGGWALGSARFMARLRAMAATTAPASAPRSRRRPPIDPDTICTAVTTYYGLEPSSLARRHDRDFTHARAMAAWLCRQYTEATLRELAERFGLSRADSVPNLTRRFAAEMSTSRALSADLQTVTRRITANTLDDRTGRSSPADRSSNRKKGVKNPR